MNQHPVRDTVITLAFICLASLCFHPAAADTHLTFHMGVGAEQQFAIGGTLQNTGDTPVERGYIVVLPVNQQCEPLPFLLHTFGPLAPHSKTPFRIPVTDPTFNAYRLVGFAAFDDMGFALPAIDDTQAIIQARQSDEVLACEQRRHMAAETPTLETRSGAER